MDKEVSSILLSKQVADELLNSLIAFLGDTTEMAEHRDDGEIKLTRGVASRLLESLDKETDAHPIKVDPVLIMARAVVVTSLRQALGVALDLESAREASPDDLVPVRISRLDAVELLNAMVSNLGSVPAVQGKSALGNEERPPESLEEWAGSTPACMMAPAGRPPKYDSWTPPPAASTGEPSKSLPANLQRYVNLWFTESKVDQRNDIVTRALICGKQVYLRVHIGPFDGRSLMNRDEAREFVSREAIAAAFPETAGKPIPLEATVFSNDFEILSEEQTQRFALVNGRPTNPVYFPLTPRIVGAGRLRLCIFYQNHLLQSLSLEADVRAGWVEWLTSLGVWNPGSKLPPASVRVEMTFSVDFANVRTLPARGLWLGINSTADDTHTLSIKTSDKAFSRNLEDQIETALREARTALLKVSFDLVKDKNGQERKQYRFDSQNYPIAATEADRQERFRQDLTTLAVAGRNLYNAVFGFVPTAEERDEVQPIVDETKAKLRDEQIIQIARLKSMEDIWPWALMYDSLIDPKLVKRVCLAYRGPKGPLSYKDGAKNCTHDRRDKTVVCPYGFWGFKHIIEQPTQPGGKKAFSDLVFQIKLSSEPVLQMLLQNALGQSESQHVAAMKALKFRALTTLKEFTAGLDPASIPPPPEPHVVYFFCHGKYDAQQNAYLQVGDDESLLPSELDELDFRWTNSHGLVFINGCHTAELQPKDLSSLMKPFVEAYASGIIGTEISVTTGLAREFAQEFFSRFLSYDTKINRKVGPIIKDLRLNLLMKYNPLGLVYTPYCSADLQVER